MKPGVQGIRQSWIVPFCMSYSQDNDFDTTGTSYGDDDFDDDDIEPMPRRFSLSSSYNDDFDDDDGDDSDNGGQDVNAGGAEGRQGSNALGETSQSYEDDGFEDDDDDDDDLGGEDVGVGWHESTRPEPVINTFQPSRLSHKPKSESVVSSVTVREERRSTMSTTSFPELELAVLNYDNDNSGNLDIDEFLGFLTSIGHAAKKEEARALFRTIDTDHSGTITLMELWQQLPPSIDEALKDSGWIFEKVSAMHVVMETLSPLARHA